MCQACTYSTNNERLPTCSCTDSWTRACWLSSKLDTAAEAQIAGAEDARLNMLDRAVHSVRTAVSVWRRTLRSCTGLVVTKEPLLRQENAPQSLHVCLLPSRVIRCLWSDNIPGFQTTSVCPVMIAISQRPNTRDASCAVDWAHTQTWSDMDPALEFHSDLPICTTVVHSPSVPAETLMSSPTARTSTFGGSCRRPITQNAHVYALSCEAEFGVLSWKDAAFHPPHSILVIIAGLDSSATVDRAPSCRPWWCDRNQPWPP